jgi:hypothetical protein
MEAAVKDAECDIIIASYGIYTTVRKDLRGSPYKEAMLSDPRCPYDAPETLRRFAKIGSRSSEPPPFFTPLPIGVLVTERFDVSPHVFERSFE